MKITISSPTEIEIKYILVTLPVNYEEEDIPNDFPLRHGDVWSAKIEIDTGRILDWPQGKTGVIKNMKVSDSGVYELQDAQGNQVAQRSDYVPHRIIPGEWGDYVSLTIDFEGMITNWPKNPDVSDFFLPSE